MAQVIESQKPVEKHQYAIRDLHVLFGKRGNRLKLAYRVIAKKSNGPAGEGRQPGEGRHLALGQQLPQSFENVALPLLAFVSALNASLAATAAHAQVWADPQKRITSDLFAALHRFQQKGIGLAPRDGKKRGNRSQQVSAYRFHHRHQRMLARQAQKFFDIRPQQHAISRR